MNIVDSLLFAALVVFCYMTALFFLALLAKDNSIADIAWGAGFIIAAVPLNPGFDEYKKRTSVFIPWFPKKS